MYYVGIDLGGTNIAAGLVSEDAKILAKVEFMNPAGSIKDRAAKSMLDDAERKGILNMLKSIFRSANERYLKKFKKIVKKNTGYIYIWHDLTHLLVKPLTEGGLSLLCIGHRYDKMTHKLIPYHFLQDLKVSDFLFHKKFSGF